MKFIHLSDLHIGKNFGGFSLIEDQKYILDEIIRIIDESDCDGVIVAGDVYDRSVPSGEAVTLFDRFITSLNSRKIPLYIISGNHDSAERLAFGSNIMRNSEIYFSDVYNGEIEKISKEDEFGKVNIYLLPFVKNVNVRQFYQDEDTTTIDSAVRCALSHCEVDESERNILVCHQFVTGATLGGSEEITVGTIENVGADAFDKFDYVALGHIHGAQKVGRDTIRYCGTPLKYSFSEMNHKKSVTVVEIGEKGDVKIDTVPLVPKREMREIKGEYNELVKLENYEGTNTDDYLQVILTDENDVANGINRLRTIYPNIVTLAYDNERTRTQRKITADTDVETKSPVQLFSEHFKMMNGREMNDEESKFIGELIDEIWSENR